MMPAAAAVADDDGKAASAAEVASMLRSTSGLSGAELQALLLRAFEQLSAMEQRLAAMERLNGIL